MYIKPIETVYKGYRFRSRLEARWGIYLDAIKLEWMYEHEGFVLADNQLYLPDFWFPDLNCFAEVKPKTLTLEEYNKCVMLPHPCILLDTPVPQLRGYYLAGKEIDIYDEYIKGEDFILGEWKYIMLDMSAYKKRLWFLCGESIEDYWLGKEAEVKAKSARFEYGEVPGV